jgi:phage shock protein C
MAAQLTRSKTDRVIAGVAGGIAERFGLNPTLVRIAWVVSAFFGGFGILAYVVLWIALPGGPAQVPAIRVAEERYARGEISAEELRRIRADLEAAGGPPGPR